MLGFSLGDLGFDLKGLDATAFDEPDDGIEGAVWRRPIAPAPKVVAFEHAREMAREMVLDNEHETFAFVSGNFVFGDLLEALVEQRRLSVRSLGIHTLSLNRENIDGIRNVLEMQPVERLDVILSNYWYAHELNTGLVGYLFEELDLDHLELRVAFAGTHCKVVTVETLRGNVLTMHGSANLRSSGNIEQLHISPDRGLWEFCEGMNQRILDAYDVMNQDDRKRRKTVRRAALWQALTTGGTSETTSGEAGVSPSPAQRSAGSGSPSSPSRQTAPVTTSTATKSRSRG